MNCIPARGDLQSMYEALSAAYGPQHWWPADSPTEVVVGAILTQNTAWSNVERAIAAMKRATCLDWCRIAEMDVDALANVIRSAGTYRVKARRVKAFADWLVAGHEGDLAASLSGDWREVRQRLLGIAGVGPETADAILLYAGGHPTFVVDAYTRRILRRHGLIEDRATYDEVKSLCEGAVPPDVQTYNELHALLVEVAKRHCRTTARCDDCPLQHFPHDQLR